MPRRSLPVAMTDHPSTQAPKKKRRAARKFASTAARKRTKAKTKASQHGVIQPLLQLPAPRPLLLLTYVGPSQQIGSSAIAIDLPRPIKNPSAPQIIEPGSEIDDAVGCDIPSGCLPAAMPDDTLTQAPKQKKTLGRSQDCWQTRAQTEDNKDQIVPARSNSAAFAACSSDPPSAAERRWGPNRFQREHDQFGALDRTAIRAATCSRRTATCRRCTLRPVGALQHTPSRHNGDI